LALLRRGLVGEPVRILQEKLGVNADGIFGKDTEAALVSFQNDNGLSADGIAGPDTFTAMGLDELVLLEKPIRGNLVRRLQEGLGIDADGVFGGGTEKAVIAFQEEKGIEATGKAGPETLRFVPGFEVTDAQVEAAVISNETPQVDTGAVEAARANEEPPPSQEHEGLVAHAIHSYENASMNIGKSIWSTVRSLF